MQWRMACAGSPCCDPTCVICIRQLLPAHSSRPGLFPDGRSVRLASPTPPARGASPRVMCVESTAHSTAQTSPHRQAGTVSATAVQPTVDNGGSINSNDQTHGCPVGDRVGRGGEGRAASCSGSPAGSHVFTAKLTRKRRRPEPVFHALQQGMNCGLHAINTACGWAAVTDDDLAEVVGYRLQSAADAAHANAGVSGTARLTRQEGGRSHSVKPVWWKCRVKCAGSALTLKTCNACCSAQSRCLIPASLELRGAGNMGTALQCTQWTG